MRKQRFAGLLLCVPLFLLCACNAGIKTLGFSSNWFRDTGLLTPEGTYEKLEYTVKFDSTPRNGFSADYREGTYVTELTTGKEEATGYDCYVLTSRLDIDVSFSLNGEKTQQYHDYVTSEVHFMGVGDRLRPLKSHKEVFSNVPITEGPTSLTGAIRAYHYTYDVSYNAALTEAQTVFTDLLAAKEEERVSEKAFEVGGDTTYLDNEQILFALRGLDLNAIVSFRSINLVQEMVQSLTFSEAPQTVEESVDFEADGERVTVSNLAATKVTLRYDGSNSGQAQTLVYARKTDSHSNTYRNVLLRMDVPIVQSLGTLQYTLNKATFTNK